MTEEATPPTVSLLRLAGGFYAIVTLFAFGYAIFDGLQGTADPENPQPFLGLGWPGFGLLFAGVGVGAVIVGACHVGMRAVPGVDKASRELAGLLGPITPREALWLAVFSGVGEELLFRGALWSHLGLLGTSLLFGLVHILPRRSLWGYPLFAAVAGLMLGLLREASGSVLPAILAHVTVNGLNLWWLSKHHARLTGAAPAEAPPAQAPAEAPAAAPTPEADAPDA